ncbi:MAG: HAD-IC family P-type ATPase [Oscillospiraceae bacterium]|nr:HAD-IC family P-type ATPase [Oscillospiraceae bacterium]
MSYTSDKIKGKLSIAAICCLFLLYFSVVPLFDILQPLVLLQAKQHPAIFSAVQAGLCLIVFFCAGTEVFVKGFNAVLQKKCCAQSLIAVGASIGFIYSCFAAFFPAKGGTDYLYFSACALLVSFALYFYYVQQHAFETAYQRTEGLQSADSTVYILRENEEQQVSLGDISANDTLVVYHGQALPFNGINQKGNALVDESHIFGYSIPVVKLSQATLYAGSINCGDTIYYTPILYPAGQERVPPDEEDREEESTDFTDYVDTPVASLICEPSFPSFTFFCTLLSVFVVLALLCGVFWFLYNGNFRSAFFFFSSTLFCCGIVGLLCSGNLLYGMAVARGLEHFVVFKNLQALLYSGKINTLFFDKTGVLTKNEIEITDMAALTCSETKLLSYAAAILADYDDPYTQAILKMAKMRKIQIPIKEKGSVKNSFAADGAVEGTLVLVGTPDFLKSKKVNFTSGDALLSNYTQKEKTVLAIAFNGELAGLLALGDVPYASTRETISVLHSLGLLSCMLTGDTPHIAKSIALTTGVTEVYAGLTAAEKAQKVALRIEKGQIAAMAGNDDNDTLALDAAHVKFVVYAAKQQIWQHGNVLLLKPDLTPLPYAVTISRCVAQLQKINILIGILLGLCSLAFACGILSAVINLYFTPVIALLFIFAAFVLCVANSYRIHFQKLK